MNIRFLDLYDSLPTKPVWLNCLPDLKIAVWEEADGYIVEYVPIHLRSLVERALLARNLLEKKHVVLHSSAVLKDEKAFLFIGKSGAGKSTLAGNAIGTLISDDTVILVPASGNFYVRGTPYGTAKGSFDSKEHPVSALCFLDQSKQLSIHPIKAAQALNLLFPAVFLPPTQEKDMEPAVPMPLVETLMKLVERIPSWKLSVPLGYRFDPKDLI